MNRKRRVAEQENLILQARSNSLSFENEEKKK
jgi:hypothetical protein